MKKEIHQTRNLPGSLTARLALGVLIAALAVGGSTATADILGPGDVIYEIQASNAAGSGSLQVMFDPFYWDPITGTYLWNLLAPISILDDFTNAPIATLDAASVFYQTDPQVSLSFAVTAGGTDTLFAITSALLGFPAISPPAVIGLASAQMGVTDLNGNGVTLTGLGPTGGGYLSQFNGLVPTGTTFAEFIPSVTAGPFLSNSAVDNIGFLPIGVPVTSMSAQFNFSLTANDVASGTSTFIIIPGPASVLLLAVAVVFKRRRRSRTSAA